MIHKLRQIVATVNAQTDFDAALQILVSRVRVALSADAAYFFSLNSEDERYLLTASDGLKEECVGQASLHLTEGLVGLVGEREEPINVAVARHHPRYQFLSTTGEEAFNSFIAVPIIDAKKMFGVLVVQRVTVGKFGVADERFLITLAAQISTILASARARSAVFPSGKQESSAQVEAPSRARFFGTGVSPGVAIGPIYVHAESSSFQSIRSRAVDDFLVEKERFQQARKAVVNDLAQLRKQVEHQLAERELALFAVYVHMLDDDAFVGEIDRRIDQGQWAPMALKSVVEEISARFVEMEDEYLRERSVDVRDLGLRLLNRLLSSHSKIPQFAEPVILVGDEISASVLLDIPRSQLAGVISVQGTSNTHMAIMARAIELPAVVGLPDFPVLSLTDQRLIVDGYKGHVIVNPSKSLQANYLSVIQHERKVMEELDAEFVQPAISACGLAIGLHANTGLTRDAEVALRRGAAGVGLYRTEVSFMGFDSFPSEEEQRLVYREQLELFAPLPVSMRTLDVGGDKSLPYFPIVESNPFLGWRGIRVTLDRPDIFLMQLRAMLKASVGLENLRILLPMVSAVSEVEEGLKLIHKAFTEVCDEGYQVVFPKVGAMLEMPAAIELAPKFAESLDFLSVGTNDLIQYLLAVDRNNPRVAGLYQAYHPVVLRTLQSLNDALANTDVELSICGEMAGDPAIAPLLIGMGYRNLSMSTASLLRVKWVLRRLSLAQMQHLAAAAQKHYCALQCRASVTQMLDELGVSEVVYPDTQIAI